MTPITLQKVAITLAIIYAGLSIFYLAFASQELNRLGSHSLPTESPTEATTEIITQSSIFMSSSERETTVFRLVAALVFMIINFIASLAVGVAIQFGKFLNFCLYYGASFLLIILVFLHFFFIWTLLLVLYHLVFYFLVYACYQDVKAKERATYFPFYQSPQVIMPSPKF